MIVESQSEPFGIILRIKSRGDVLGLFTQVKFPLQVLRENQEVSEASRIINDRLISPFSNHHLAAFSFQMFSPTSI
jgi:hypothetical protein